MNVNSKEQKTHSKHMVRNIFIVLGAIFVIYGVVMAYLFYHPITEFEVYLPKNGSKPSVYNQETFVSVNAMPINGFGWAELWLIPPSHIHLSAHVAGGGSLTELKAKDTDIQCASVLNETCRIITSPNGQKISYTEVKSDETDKSRATTRYISFIKGNTIITLTFGSDYALNLDDDTAIGNYVDSFERSTDSSSVTHFFYGAA